VEILEWIFEHGTPCNPIQNFKLGIYHGKPDVLNWAMKKFQPKIEDLSFLVNLTQDSKNPGVSLTWLQNSGIPFPCDFYEEVHCTICTRAKMWVIQRSIPYEAQGAWREVEELLEGGECQDAAERRNDC
jgi:hypothetical protein